MWLHTVDISVPFKNLVEDKVTLHVGACQIADILDEKFPPAENATVAKIAARFRRVRSVNGFDSVMESLYDWGDEVVGIKSRRCFVRTF